MVKEANALNITYEDNIWTPILSFGITSGSDVIYKKQLANFIRWGNMIDFSIQISITNKGAGAGDARISLPYSCRNINDYTCPISVSNLSFQNSKVLTGYIEAGKKYVNIVINGPGSDKSKGDHNIFNNNSEINISGRYFIN